MIRAERETHISYNQADADEGFFMFFTSIASHWDKLCKRVGEDRLLEVRKSKDALSGRTTGWSCRVPICYYQLSTFGIRTHDAVVSNKAKSERMKGSTPAWGR